ncbi:rRNA maturation RNase YbeY [Candidatus Dependentiae bacterium]|nr:rRNA maturation RNase YbeY [Candidatus Dependentiae bacterium]
MIYVQSRLKKYTIDKEKYRSFVQKILNELDYPDFDISIIFTTNKAIHNLNKQFRNKDKPTDVLSFPHHPTLKAGKRIKVIYDDDKALGDIILSVEYIDNAGPVFGKTLEENIEYLIAHGIAHLLGHDHIKDNEYKVMRRLEERILRTARNN